MTDIKLNKNQVLELKSLATFGADGTTWPTKDAKKFESLGVVELGSDVEGGQTQIRISANGSQYLKDLEPAVDTGSNSGNDGNQSGANAEQPKPSGVKQMFQIESNVDIPAASRRTRTSAFPFDQLEVGQSFFVAATEDRKDPAKSLASTVNGANERHSEVIPGQTVVNRKGNTVAAKKPLRKFIVRAVTETHDGVEVQGARVWRVALDAE